ncbi:collagen alpha-1(II) chain-like [Meriones unguiculatus]|uniref:collagen alpha-1(II) chain-like n=1 Tax=Meriones unguiculatus TaxID=10047 RepID=UPI00293E1243|nr:collagen alpha-1(II) chain-like [Meriones unguiculatus]XP_060223662.1 collagen alpha-1(II) chain-like [Meriones unguiculatus]
MLTPPSRDLQDRFGDQSQCAGGAGGATRGPGPADSSGRAGAGSPAQGDPGVHPPTRSDLTLPRSGSAAAAWRAQEPAGAGPGWGTAGAGLAPGAALAGLAQLTRRRAAPGRGGGGGAGAESHLCLQLCRSPTGPGRELLLRRRCLRCPGDRGPRGGPGGRSSGSRRPAPPRAPRPARPLRLLPSRWALGSRLPGSARLAGYFPGCGGKSCGSTEPRPAPPRRVLAPAPVSPGEGAKSGRSFTPAEDWGPRSISRRRSEVAK